MQSSLREALSLCGPATVVGLCPSHPRAHDHPFRRRLIQSNQHKDLDASLSSSAVKDVLAVLKAAMNQHRTMLRLSIAAGIGADAVLDVNVERYLQHGANKAEAAQVKDRFLAMLGINDDVIMKCGRAEEVGDPHITEAGEQFHRAIMTHAELYGWMYDIWASRSLTVDPLDDECERDIRVNGSWIVAHWMGSMCVIRGIGCSVY